MSTTQYNPDIHHRRSIRLRGHDYAGGGLYFVTICAHRNAGDIFAAHAVGEMVSRVWRELPQSTAVGACLVPANPRPRAHVGAPLVGAQIPAQEAARKAAREGTHEGCPYVVMPDHFHALVRMRAGKIALGEAVGAFKSLVMHEYIAGVKRGEYKPFPGKIWHRNYYEMIVRTPEAERNIREYILMNPWKLVQHAVHEGQSFRMIGNPALLTRDKIALLCSRACPPETLRAACSRAKAAGPLSCFLSGFHSPPEKAILEALLQSGAKLICCPAWGIDSMRIPSDWLPALEANRMLVLEMRNRDGNLSAAAARNAFVIETAEKLWLPYVAAGGLLAKLTQAQSTQNKISKD